MHEIQSSPIQVAHEGNNYYNTQAEPQEIDKQNVSRAVTKNTRAII